MEKKGFITMEKKIDVDVCADIQTADLMRRTSLSTMITMIDHHLKDADDTITGTPLFDGLIKMAVEQWEDWERQKQEMLKNIEVEEDKQITNWDLEYATCNLTYGVGAAATAKLEVEIAEDVCKSVQDAQTKLAVLREVQINIMDIYKEDATGFLFQSPYFKSLNKLVFGAESDFELKKAEMIAGVEVGDGSHWDLNYYDHTLRIYW